MTKPIIFLIRKLEIGGAERQLLTLVRNLPAYGFSPIVVPFYDGGGLWNDFKSSSGVRGAGLWR